MRGFFITMTKISELTLQAKQKWGEKPDALAIEVWLADCLGKTKEYLFIESQEEVSIETETRFWQGVDQMIEGLPLAQLRGKKEFYGLDFVINQDVLIPRPESELVVDLARKYIAENAVGREVRVVDVGTGSGCLLMALCKSENLVQGLGLDISEKALLVAEKNLQKLGLGKTIELRQSDLLGAMADFKPEIVLANLPYIGTEKFHFVAKDVEKYEPAVALFGGSDGLELYKKMFDQINNMAEQPKVVIGEFGFGQAESMMTLLMQQFPKAKSREIINDLAGIPRVFMLKW